MRVTDVDANSKLQQLIDAGPGGGGGGGTVTQGDPGADPWLVQDDAVQGVLETVSSQLNDIASNTAASANTEYTDGSSTEANPLGTVVMWKDSLSSNAIRAVSPAKPLPVADSANGTLIGAVTETAPASDTASSGLNGRLQRIAQRLTSLIGLLPTALGANGGLKVEGVASGTAVPASIADGSDVATGSKADVAWVSGSGSVIAILKAIAAKAVLWAFDSTDRQRVSLYGKNSVAGDTALNVTPTGVVGVSSLSSSAAPDAANTAPNYFHADGDALRFGATVGYLLNGATFDKPRNNLESTLLASAARTTATNSTTQTNYNGRGVRVSVDVTAGSGFSITPKIQVQDSVSGVWSDVLVGAAITSTGHVELVAGPGITDATNLAKSTYLGRTWRFRMEVADATSATYSAAAAVLL